jgi:hypothetical protein
MHGIFFEVNLIFDVKTYDIVLRNVESTEGGSEAATPVISL